MTRSARVAPGGAAWAGYSGAAPPSGGFPVAVSGRVLVDDAGLPWYGIGDAAWSLFAQLSLAEAQTYLDSIAAKGFNLTMANLVEKNYLDGTAGTNYAGASAWTGTAFQSSLNATYWDHVDDIIEYAATKGITVLACPAYIGFIHGGEGWSSQVDTAGDTNMRTYGENIGNRLKAHPNILWLIGHDAAPNATDFARQGAMWAGIRTDAGDSHLMTVGSEPASSGYDDWGSWAYLADVDFDTAYNSSGTPVGETATAYANGLPVLFVEGAYEDHPTNWSAQRGRYQMAGGFCAGALAGYISGHEAVWGFGQGIYEGDGNWTDDLDDVSYTDTARLGVILADRTGMLPDTTDTFLTVGEASTTTQAAAAFDAAAGAVVYMPTSRAVTLDLTELTGSSFTITRVDPTSGTESVLTTTASGSHEVASQGTNAGGASDWLLLVEAT